MVNKNDEFEAKFLSLLLEKIMKRNRNLSSHKKTKKILFHFFTKKSNRLDAKKRGGHRPISKIQKVSWRSPIYFLAAADPRVSLSFPLLTGRREDKAICFWMRWNAAAFIRSHACYFKDDRSSSR